MKAKDMERTEVDGSAIEFCYVEGGEFEMGSNRNERERPIHKVTVPSFYLGRYPITNQQFVPFLNEQGNQEEGGAAWVNLDGNFSGVSCGIEEVDGTYHCIKGQEHHPMIYVSWYGARAYCKWLSNKTGQAIRLPSEAEWEYAAKGGKHKSPFLYAGSNHLDEVGWYRTNSHRQTKPVGLKYPNQLSLYDMSGNVWEWCADHWHENYNDAPSDGTAWVKGGNSERRVVRGGSWYDIDGYCRVSYRLGFDAIGGFVNIGFRVSRY